MWTTFVYKWITIPSSINDTIFYKNDNGSYCVEFLKKLLNIDTDISIENIEAISNDNNNNSNSTHYTAFSYPIIFSRINDYLVDLKLMIPIYNNNNNGNPTTTTTTNNNSINYSQISSFDIYGFHVSNHILQDQVIDDFKTIFNQISHDYKVDILITKYDFLNLLNDTDNDSPCLYVVGQINILTFLQNVIEFIISNHTFSQRIPLLTAYSVPMIIGPNSINVNYFKSIYNISLHVPTLSNLTHSDLYIGGYNNLTTEATLEYVTAKFNKFLTDLYPIQNTIPSPFCINTIPLGKILFLKKFRLSHLNSLSIKHQTCIHFNEINNDNKFCSYPLLVHGSSTDLIQSCLKDLSLSVLQNLIEVTFYFDSIILDLYSLFNILEGEEYVVVTPLDDLISNPIDSFTLIIDYNRFLQIVDKLLSLPFAEKLVQFKTIFQIHYDFEQFISGKKNGKLIKIMDQQPNCILRLLNEKSNDKNDILMNLELINGPEKIEYKQSLKLIIDELPIEESFHIGEVFHRPIIGAGGSIIQTIMRKYNVFIQFSNSFNLPQLNWSLVRYPNVIIRCPRKNMAKIKSAKEEILSLVDKFRINQDLQSIQLSFAMYHFITLNKKHIKIPQIEKTYNVDINFPTPNEMKNYVDESFTLTIGSSFNNNQSNKITTLSNEQTYTNNNNMNNKKTALNAMNKFKEVICGKETIFVMSENFKTFIKEQNEWFHDTITLQLESLCQCILRVSNDLESLQLIYQSSKEYAIVLHYLEALKDKFNITVITEKHIS